MTTSWLANTFNKLREIIEAAETPFAKLTVFVLPVLAPLVPAAMTSFHMYQLFIIIFHFAYADKVSLILVVVIALVLEMLGYVGAISFIRSIFDWIRTRQNEYLLPMFLNGGAYLFYLIAMFFINVELGKYFETPTIVNNIFGLLSFVTVPSGLLAANHLNEVSDTERQERLRQEERSDRMERFRIKHGNLPAGSETSQKVSRRKRKFPESFYEFSHWRKLSPTLSKEELEIIANFSATDMKELSDETGLTAKTYGNWKSYAQEELSKNQPFRF